ncbi:hypothetical protein MNBD_GAMMA21-2307 [hydrothermal vent metagenome]|uniref:Yip1 domain-containing protein n=1 Tax=hydrothermal vent metagenome TaxID=652676 RepID=A0A3B1A553_9ZZZZ
MHTLFRLFFDIALLRKGPQDVPYSLFLLVFLFVFEFTMDIAINLIPDFEGKTLDFWINARFYVVANAVIVVFIYIIFKFYGKADRFVQSLTAITGAGLILIFIQLPAKFLVMNSAGNEPSMPVALAVLFSLVVLVWNLAIYINVFRLALSTSRINAGMLSFVILILSLFLRSLLVPVAA